MKHIKRGSFIVNKFDNKTYYVSDLLKFDDYKGVLCVENDIWVDYIKVRLATEEEITNFLTTRPDLFVDLL